jgi:hypothetical protein
MFADLLAPREIGYFIFRAGRRLHEPAEQRHRF